MLKISSIYSKLYEEITEQKKNRTICRYGNSRIVD